MTCRDKLLKQQRMASDGISQSTLEELYDYFYQLSVKQDHQRVRLLLSSSVQDIQRASDGTYQLDVLSTDCNARLVLDADIIVLATGYKTVVPEFLNPIRSRLEYIQLDLDEEIKVKKRWVLPSRA